MIKNTPIIGVADVEASSKWYQQLLRCSGLHGGDEFEMLGESHESLFLCLHKWGVHEHPTMASADGAGAGLILYITVDDLQQVWSRAQEMNAVVEEEPHISKNSHREQFCIKDMDGYYLMITA